MDRKNEKRNLERAGIREAKRKVQRMELLDILTTKRQERDDGSESGDSDDAGLDLINLEANHCDNFEGEVHNEMHNQGVHDSDSDEVVSNPSEQNALSPRLHRARDVSSESDLDESSSSTDGSSNNSGLEREEEHDYANIDEQPAILDPDKYVLEQLTEWAAFNVSKQKVDDLLRRLKPVHRNLPLSYKTLLGTPSVIETKECGNGSVWYHGIKPHLQRLLSLNYLQIHEKIFIDVNIDGIPLFKNRKKSFTPILGRLVNIPKPFCIGVYYGVGDPKDIDVFLEDFVDEVNHLTQNGFEFEGTVYPFEVRYYILDKKARSQVKRVKGVRGYYCCEKCVVEGTDYMNRMCLLQHDCALRTDESFIDLVSKLMAPRAEHYDDEEVDDHIIGISPLLQCEKKLVSKFVLESMHLVYKGSFLRWIDFVYSERLDPATVSSISDELVNLKRYIPQDFNRKPQPLRFYSSYKATELRRLLLYDGLVVFSRFIHPNIYKNFLLLHAGIFILCSPQLFQTLNEEANMFLRAFVDHSREIFGAQFISHNIHSMVHLAPECKACGPLDSFGAFPFENYLKTIKETLMSGYQPLQQIARREMEQIKVPIPAKNKVERTLQMKRTNDADEQVPGQQYRKLCLENMTFVLNAADSCCKLKDGSVCVIENLIETNGGNAVVVGKKFLMCEDFYAYPLESHLLG